jgi:hypothetical protein
MCADPISIEIARMTASFHAVPRFPLMGWSGRAPAPPAMEAGKGRQLQSFDAALVGRCAPILERAGAAHLRQVNPHFLASFISGELVRQLLAGRAAIDIVLGQINKIRFPKTTCRLGARGLRLGQRDCDAGLFARQDFLTFKIAPIRNDFQVIAAQRGFRRLRHRRQLRSIGTDVGDLVRDNPGASRRRNTPVRDRRSCFETAARRSTVCRAMERGWAVSTDRM